MKVAELIDSVNFEDCSYPLLLRFFDFELYSSNQHIQYPPGYMGYRGVRLLEIDDNLLRKFTQLLDALNVDNVITILPMITSPSEVTTFKRKLNKRWSKIGITIETPAAALMINELLQVVDFIEIGLNDLTQYTMAWDRDFANDDRLPNDRIAEPVARLIKSVIQECNKRNTEYTLGIDLKPSAALADQLLNIGVKSISCSETLAKFWDEILT